MKSDSIFPVCQKCGKDALSRVTSKQRRIFKCNSCGFECEIGVNEANFMQPSCDHAVMTCIYCNGTFVDMHTKLKRLENELSLERQKRKCV